MSLSLNSCTTNKRIRQNFARIPSIAQIPNLIQVQKRSYEAFLQISCTPNERQKKGLEAIFKSIFPITDSENRSTIEYIKYTLGTPKYDIFEAIQRGVNYAVPLIVTMRLIIWEDDEGVKNIRSVKEQDVYMGEIPLMTDSGTFIINGAQRVIVSQMHRSPGVFYFHDGGKSNMAGKYLYSTSVIPYRGSWLDFEFDSKDLLFFRIDRKRKIYVTTLLRAIGYSRDDIFKEFYNFRTYKRVDDHWVAPLSIALCKGIKVSKDIIDAENGEILIASGTRITPKVIREKSSIKDRLYIVNDEDIVGSYIATSISDPYSNEEIIPSGHELTISTLNYLRSELGINEIQILDIDHISIGPYIRNTLIVDKNNTKEDALYDIYRVLRPGEPATFEAAEELLRMTFFDNDRYDLSAVGRMKINIKHGLSVPEDYTCLRSEDIVAFIKYLVALRDGKGDVDDIDSLSNRRVRSVGELIENQFRLALVRIERSVLERMNSIEIDTVMPHDLVNSKAVMSVISEFFGTSQLSQFMDQTNPLSEVTHKRRISALGPGGLTRERAGFAVRDVHPTHYGRICPIETPEGQNIGLINSLATYACINKYGFLESPYRKVVNSKVTDEVCYLSAIEEPKYTIAQANAGILPDGSFQDDSMSCRRNGDFIMASAEEINYIDVSPKQLVSVAASLIPFLENDDANRALMGSNMQRQAVPLLRSEAPLVGTGMEGIVARDSGAIITALADGIVEHADSARIVVRRTNDADFGVDIYTLAKYQKSNHGTCLNQKPIVKVGDIIKDGDVLADGPCTDLGELALGKNVLVAFMPWNGYNFEDSILISKRMVSDDEFTSIHINELESIARDTRLGPEEITRDIPNVPEENLLHLDENGIVLIGSEVTAGDILVGKVTPKSESPLTPEEKLLRAIFGEKAAEVRDSSLRVPPGERYTVVGVRVFTRRGVEKNEKAIALEKLEIERLTRDRNDQLAIIEKFIYEKLAKTLKNNTTKNNHKHIASGTIVTEDVLSNIPRRYWWQIVVNDKDVMNKLDVLKDFYEEKRTTLDNNLKDKIERLQNGDDLPQGALRVVKVYLATKLKLQPGDKIAGRHGNKGVVSKIAQIEDMPFLEDGTPVDIVLNPLGVPSRMNVGQILETHLGWASAGLGKQVSAMLQKYQEDASNSKLEELRQTLVEIYSRKAEKKSIASDEACSVIENMNQESLVELATNLKKGVPFATPVFDGAKEDDVNEMLVKAGLCTSGQVTLMDGRTGEPFDRKVTVGYIYMLKLDHLVDNKIHARSVGPYSLVTQQPLGGKQYFGGQRFGEMECWTLEAYGAAYTLQEMLTVKSDDVTGRVKVYEGIVKGDYNFESGIPESFNVMIKELRSLCLNIDLLEGEEENKNK